MTTPDNKSSESHIEGGQPLDRFGALWVEYMTERKEIRQDTVAVSGFQKDSPDAYQLAEKLFWEVTQPTSMSSSNKRFIYENAPSLPTKLEEALLEKLAEYELDCRVEYFPDQDWIEVLDDMLVYIYIAAAKALRLKLKDGYSEETRQSLESAFRIATRYAPNPDVYEIEDAPGVPSQYAAIGMVLKELFRVYKLDRKYEEAFRYLALSIRFLGCAFTSTSYIAEEGEWSTDERRQAYDLWDRMSPYFRTDHPTAHPEILLMSEPRQPIFDVDPLEAIEAFRLLKEDGKNRDVAWKQVAKDCETVGNYWGVCLGYEDFVLNELMEDPDGKERSWFQLWTLNQGSAQNELEPNKLRDYLRDERREREDEQAERRLRTYFFDEGIWNILPELAKRSLVSADREWFSSSRSRFESVFNDLMKAAEILFYDFLWEAVGKSEGGLGFLQFINKTKELDDTLKQPGISEYIWLLEQPFFKEFAGKSNLAPQEIRFLTVNLKTALKDLRYQRNIAQHELKREWKRQEVKGYLNKFLGVGYPGILPLFAEIGAKLKNTKPG